jgi:hypothetical protein
MTDQKRSNTAAPSDAGAPSALTDFSGASRAQQRALAAHQERLTTEAKLWAIWRGLLDTFIHYLTVTPPEKRKASTLDVVLRYLQHNGVTLHGGSPDPLRATLKQMQDIKLPFTGTDKGEDE